MEASAENIQRITDFIDAELDRMGCSLKARTQIDIATDEIIANIASYAYSPGRGEVEVEIDFDAQNRTAVISFLDSGVDFNPLTKKNPDVTLPAEERKIGGLGIFLVRKTMDAMEYRREKGQNILTIRKRIE